MCCRIYLNADDRELAPLLDAALRSPLLSRFSQIPPLRAGELFPSNLAPALASDRQLSPAVFPMLWGFSLQGRRTAIINARVETAAEKPSFREAWQKHRCAIPASWYFEWKQEASSAQKTKYAIRPKEPALIWLCGLYRVEGGLPVFVILTRPAEGELAEIHDRMPLILPKDAIRQWVHPQANPKALLAYAQTELVAVCAQ